MLDLRAALRRNHPMFPTRRVPLALPILLVMTTPAMAQQMPGTRTPWATLTDSSPALWSCVLVASILAAALLAHLLFVLRRSRAAPAGLVDALGNAIQSGNYQEAWDTCHRRGETALGRMLQPALERIGQGRDSVEARLAEEGQRELKHFSQLLRALLAIAGGAVLLCVTGAMGELRAVGGTSLTPDAPRASALAWGNAAMFAAFAIAVAVPATIAWSWLRVQAEALLDDAAERGLQLLAGLPYEDIEGVRIGRDFHAGTLLGGGADLGQTGRLQVSKELTTQCPTCNGPINSSRNSCPHCGQLLSWS
jgi:biopolymer transport protein ExbB/TolQ